MKIDSKSAAKARVNKGKGKLAAAACAMVLTLGAAGVFFFTGESIETTDKDEVTSASTVQMTQATTTTQETSSQDTVTQKKQIQWHKAGIAEYEVASARQTTTTTPKATTTTSASTSKPMATTTTKSAAVTAATTKATTKAATKATAKATTKATTKAAAKPAVTTTTPANRTIYNSPKISYTAQEFDMMCYVVQAEVGNCSEAYKIAVANVIINRVKSPRFTYAKNIKSVLTAGGQFDSISNYYSKRNPPNQSTINCCKRALNGEDNSNGAVYYYSPKICGTIAWFESMQCCLYLDSGLYSAKFFKPW
jgi:spore germination cell wall hydrolase CwlJ-like protein